MCLPQLCKILNSQRKILCFIEMRVTSACLTNFFKRLDLRNLDWICNELRKQTFCNCTCKDACVFSWLFDIAKNKKINSKAKFNSQGSGSARQSRTYGLLFFICYLPSIFCNLAIAFVPEPTYFFSFFDFVHLVLKILPCTICKRL